ncbi:MAG: YeeE/YedE family protein [Candidatus Rokubacteria bacterium]|nr:YeeE/YedE family protein [Candidatus Rokubacteria bacterium]
MLKAFSEQYAALFARPWPAWGAAILVATVNVFLFAFDRPWTASDGMRNWGDWVLKGAGVIERTDLIPPWLYSGSLLNGGVLAGGLVAALLSREFAVRMAPRGELAKGALGGALLGIGAMLALGCNIGGFFSATSALSLSGLGMMLGLVAGAYLGLRYLLWEMEHRPGWSSGSARVFGGPRADAPSLQPVAGAVVLLVLLALPFVYARAGYVPQGIFLLFGLAFGVIFQRSRFCLVRAFREPFMTGDGEHTRAAAMAVVISMLGFAILKFTDLKDKGEWVFASAGVGSILGGLIFGIGMVLAGGCGAGSIWRAGEGQVKLWATIVCFALGASLTRLALTLTGLQQKLGVAVFMPSVLGWGGAIVLVVLVMAAWAAFATWNEESRRFSAL